MQIQNSQQYNQMSAGMQPNYLSVPIYNNNA